MFSFLTKFYLLFDFGTKILGKIVFYNLLRICREQNLKQVLHFDWFLTPSEDFMANERPLDQK